MRPRRAGRLQATVGSMDTLQFHQIDSPIGRLGLVVTSKGLAKVLFECDDIDAERDRAEASSMYVFCYYMGSSILGAATGWAYEGLQWAGFVAVLAALLGVLAVVSAALWRGAR